MCYSIPKYLYSLNTLTENQEFSFNTQQMFKCIVYKTQCNYFVSKQVPHINSITFI